MTLTAIAGSANVPLATSIAHELGVELCERKVQRFADGELHIEIEQSVRGHDVYVIGPTSHPVDTSWSCFFSPTPAVAPAQRA